MWILREREKSSLEHHSDNCCKYDLLMEAKICEQKLKEKQNIYTSLKYFFQIINYKSKDSNLADTTLTK